MRIVGGKYRHRLIVFPDDMEHTRPTKDRIREAIFSALGDLTNYKGFAFDYSSYDDIAELYLISDILITDYSSVFFDFANLKRPILFYPYDLEEYNRIDRGFYIDIYNDLPGPLLFTTEEIIDSVKNIDKVKEEYCEIYEGFYEEFCNFEDGTASKRIVEKVWGVD